MKKKTTWAASVVKKQLQTCCKHQPAFSLETTERDDNTSQEIHISSPIKETSASSNPVLLRRRSFTVAHARSLLTTPEPLTPFRKSVESAIPLCRSSSTFKAGRLQKTEELVVAPSKPGKVLHKSGPLPVLQQLFRLQGASPLIVKKQLSGPLMSCKPRSAAPSPKQGPSPQRLSKVKFSPIPHGITAIRKLADVIAAEEHIIAPPVPDRERESWYPSPEAKSVAPPAAAIAGEPEQDHVTAAAVRIQAAFRGYLARKRLGCPTVSISTQMSRTDPQKLQRRTPPPRATRGWNGSMRSAHDHQALLRTRQEAALKRERAMEYALSRQRWRPGAKKAGPDLDDRVPDKPGWVRSWLERASRMSAAQNSQTHIEEQSPQSESLSVKSTVGMCTTDIASVVDVNLGWPLSLRQQHAAGLLPPKSPIPSSPPIEILPSTTTASSSDDPGSSTSELIQSTRPHDMESVGSCDGPVLPSPVVTPAAKPRKLSNSNSLKRDRLQQLVFAQTQVSVALSDDDSVDTTAASVMQRPLWR